MYLLQKNWVFLSFFSFSKLWKVKKTKLEKEIELDWKKVTGERGKAFSTNVQQNFQMCSEKMTETTFFETIISWKWTFSKQKVWNRRDSNSISSDIICEKERVCLTNLFPFFFKAQTRSLHFIRCLSSRNKSFALLCYALLFKKLQPTLSAPAI